MMEANEREVYRAAIHGDRDAFEMIIRQQSRPLFAIAYGILQNREETEDAVQDALVKAWKSRWRVRDPEKFPAWLAMIVRHRARDIFKKRRTIPLSQTHDAIESEPTNTTSLDRQLHSALSTLPEVHRSALMLRYFEEMDYRTIENALGLTNGALRGILGRALATMRRQLRPALSSLNQSLLFTTTSTIYWPRISTANFRTANATSFRAISSTAPLAARHFRKPKL
jgi:RNA polymerase sigma-70 factor, ECF subfamily